MLPKGTSTLRYYPEGSAKPDMAVNLTVYRGELYRETSGTRERIRTGLGAEPIGNELAEIIYAAPQGSSRTTSSQPYFIAYDENGRPIDVEGTKSNGQAQSPTDGLSAAIDRMAHAGPEYEWEKRRGEAIPAYAPHPAERATPSPSPRRSRP